MGEQEEWQVYPGLCWHANKIAIELLGYTEVGWEGWKRAGAAMEHMLIQ